jgi:hypothetical protein
LASGYSRGLGSTGKSRRWRTASANVGLWIEVIPRYRQYLRPIVSLPRFCFDALIAANSIGMRDKKFLGKESIMTLEKIQPTSQAGDASTRGFLPPP